MTLKVKIMTRVPLRIEGCRIILQSIKVKSLNQLIKPFFGPGASKKHEVFFILC